MSIDEWFKEFGKNTTSNLQLVKYCKKLNIHNVVICMRDELTNVPKHTNNIIMNLEITRRRLGINAEWMYFLQNPWT